MPFSSRDLLFFEEKCSNTRENRCHERIGLNLREQMRGMCKTCFARNITGSENRKWDIQKKCTRQPVLTAERNVKFHSSQTVPGQFIAESAIANEDHHADSKLLS